MTAGRTPLADEVTVVIATRNRAVQLDVALGHLLEAPERNRPAILVVDNASSDDTAAVARRRGVQVVVLDRNEGAAARNVGAATAATDLVAFNDDDSWWAPGSLGDACRRFRDEPRLGLLAARILIGPEQRLDPASAEMAASPLPDREPPPTTDPIHDLDPRCAPGPRVLGFLACGAVVRRSAFLAVGGFSRTLFFMGEEAMVAMDLAAQGWDLRYDDRLVVHHHPSSVTRPSNERLALQRRNALLTSWMRRPRRHAIGATLGELSGVIRDPVAWTVLGGAVRVLPAVLRDRRVAPPEVEADLRLLESSAPAVPDPPWSAAPNGTGPRHR